MNSEADSYFITVSKVFYFHSSIYERARKRRCLPRLPLRDYYSAVLFQDTYASSSYMLLIYVNYLHRCVMCYGPSYPQDPEERAKRHSEIELSKIRWSEFYGNKGAMYFRDEFNKASIYREHRVRICNGFECLPSCEVKNSFYQALQSSCLERGTISFQGGGVFQFRDNIYYYYRRLGVYLKTFLPQRPESSSLLCCGSFHKLEEWNQEALYCYVVMRLRI